MEVVIHFEENGSADTNETSVMGAQKERSKEVPEKLKPERSYIIKNLQTKKLPEEIDLHELLNSMAQLLYYFSKTETELFIGEKLVVTTSINTPSNGTKSADFTFELSSIKEYTLLSIDINEEPGDSNSVSIFNFDEGDFIIPLHTIEKRSGKDYSWVENLLPDDSWATTDYMRWSLETIGIKNRGVKDGKMYIQVYYFGLIDTYVFDLKNKTGSWMSKADDLTVFYEKELPYIWEGEYHASIYHHYNVLLLSEHHDYAIMLRTKELGQYKNKNEYLLRNLKTGDEIFICRSYADDREGYEGYGMWVSWMEEDGGWNDNDSFYIIAWENGADGIRYDVTFDGKRWHIKESKEYSWND